MDNPRMSTSNKIKALRKEAGLTQQQLGDRIRSAHSIIGKLENGKQDLTEYYIFKLCDALHCTPNDLLGFSRPQPTLHADAMAYAINLAIEVVGGLRDADPLDYVADIVRHTLLLPVRFRAS